MLNPLMAKRHVKGMCGLMIEPIEEFVADQDRQGDRFEVEMASAMTALTLDVVGAALFGHQFGELAQRMRKVVTGGLRASEVATRALMIAAPPAQLIRAWAGAIRRAPVLPKPLAEVQWVMKTIDETIWDVVNERRRNPRDADDLLNLLLGAEDEHGKLPLRRVRDEATTFMLAGHETTANALAWTWHLLALNREARERMLAEVDGVLGARRPTVDDIPRLPWTTACFQEGMRFYPPAWSIPRTAIHEDAIDGHRIPRGATVIVPIYAIHHDERFWPEPESYDPTRFLAENTKGRHRSAYLPFGGGRRVCIGSSFALMESTLIMAMMSQRFVYDPVPGHPVEPEATLTLRPRYGVKMIAHRRAEAPEIVAA
jgi:cytochrome P450